MVLHPIELLAPARDLECGIAAVNHGADAVYIGAPRFGARAAAGNSLADVERLIRHAHLFGVRVYIALNTLFFDSELDEAVRLTHQLYDIGADALIIQDMGLLECGLPPIPLHASTQTNNRTPEKVRFLEEVGFRQVVLARELSLGQIRAIRQQTSVPLECFIHGALCVSYSGQCYISEQVSSRSGNRGECAQFCRHRYTLRDGMGRIVEQDRYLLSLKDLDLSAHVGELIEAGVSSFKIEGRLKDSVYVKNVTAHYRLLLDGILEGRPELSRASSGHCRFPFVPDTAKSFNRGKTDYFMREERARAGSIFSPKSLGEPIGTVVRTGRDWFRVKTQVALHNGDGLCYFDKDRELIGVKANRVEQGTIFHRNERSPDAGTQVFRNYDGEFVRAVRQSDQCRLLRLSAEVREVPTGLAVVLEDEDCIRSETVLAMERVEAMRPGKVADLIARQMRKCGGTCFEIAHVLVEVDAGRHLQASSVNELRRLALARHEEERLAVYLRELAEFSPNQVPWLSDQVDFLDNITNARAMAFYRRHGVERFDLSAEACTAGKDSQLMRTRYCIRAQLGICLKEGGGDFIEPFTLTDNTGTYIVTFDCRSCEMILSRTPK